MCGKEQDEREAQQKTRSSSENRVAETLVENAQHLGPLIPEVMVKTHLAGLLARGYASAASAHAFPSVIRKVA